MKRGQEVAPVNLGPAEGGADLSGTDGMGAEFLDDFCGFTGRDALDIHLGQREHEGSFAADALFQSAGIKVHAVANLGDAELDGADTGGEGFGFEPVGAAQAAVAALVGKGMEDGAALLNHGLIDEEAQALGKAGRALGGEQLQNGVYTKIY